MKLTILSPLPPYPPRAGGTAHIVQAVQQLARFYRVSLYALAADPAAVAWGPLAEWCEETRAFERASRLARGIAPPGVRQEHSPALIAPRKRHALLKSLVLLVCRSGSPMQRTSP